MVKPEHLQRTGSFKIRGAYNFLCRRVEEGFTGPVVAASAGNHAQGVALAAQLLALHNTVFMPATAALPKIEATRGYGSDVIFGGETVDDCVEDARAYAGLSGALFVPPFDDPDVIAGQGTVGLEMHAELRDGDVVVVPVGGGGLLSGIAAAVKLSGSKARVVGVEPSGAASMSLALARGRPTPVQDMRTIADGVAVRSASALTYEHVAAFVDEIVTVEEQEISQAVLATLERAKWLVEPAGAVGLAAVLNEKIMVKGRTFIVLSGGNIDPLLLTKIVEYGLTAAGRYLMLRIVLPDRPGALAELTASVAALGLNVLSVEHHRSGSPAGFDEVEVFLTLETRGPAHREAVISDLRSRGIHVALVSSERS